jgi:hypothetical protein
MHGTAQSIVSRALFNSTVGADFAFCHGFYQLAGAPKAAGQPIIFWMRATGCMT